MVKETGNPIGEDEAASLFGDLADARAVLLAVSGGADSTALLLLVGEWSKTRGGPRIRAATVDHGLRAGSREEAARVARLAAELAVEHRILTWRGEKPQTGLEKAARAARYRLLSEFAAEAGASHLVTAHTLDDQAETVLLRLASGSGPAGLAAMRPLVRQGDLVHARPFLRVPKARLVTTLEARGRHWDEDGMNSDPRFARPRLRAAREVLEREGLTAGRLGVLARRMARMTDALARVSAAAWPEVARQEGTRTVLEGAALLALPEEIALRLLIRGIGDHGDQPADRLARSEAVLTAVRGALSSGGETSRTLAGAKITVRRGQVEIAAAPPRRPR